MARCFSYALRFAGEHLQCDKEVVRAAVAQNGYALRYGAKDLHADFDVAIAAVAQVRPRGPAQPGLSHYHTARCLARRLTVCSRVWGVCDSGHHGAWSVACPHYTPVKISMKSIRRKGGGPHRARYDRVPSSLPFPAPPC